MSYRGPGELKRGKYKEWFIFTVIMGAIPSIIRLLVCVCFEQQPMFEDFRTEIFFLSIVLLVDSLKNRGLRDWNGAVSFIVLCFCIFGYAVVFFDASHLFSRSPSVMLVRRGALVFLILGFLLDWHSVSKK